MRSLEQIDGWPAAHAAAGLAGPAGVVATRGAVERPFAWASVTKVLTALAALVAVEEETIDLDQPAGPPGATVRHLLAHASGLPLEAGPPVAEPGRRRIYSNAGFETLADVIAGAAGMPFAEYVTEGVIRPLGLAGTTVDGSPAWGGHGPLPDLLALGTELLVPSLVAPATLAEATRTAFPGLAGVLPGVGSYDPNDWGLGLELRDGKSPHWTGRRNSSRTFGHFGRSGSFLWVDPDARLACAALGDLDFGSWARAAWPALSDAILDELG